jgi:ribosomal protein S19
MIGHKFGEFVFTRAKFSFQKKKKLKKINYMGQKTNPIILRLGK